MNYTQKMKEIQIVNQIKNQILFPIQKNEDSKYEERNKIDKTFNKNNIIIYLNKYSKIFKYKIFYLIKN